ncbi:MAG: hypothetical protein AB1728_04045 [Bacteroidota bacterium]
MKAVTRFLPVFFFVLVSLPLSGCYTELATNEYADDEYYAGSDTTYDQEGNVTINNNYYLDDDYRRSRFRLSFNYYYPSYHSSWIAGYYHSFYDDPYWGWYRPWWWYHYYPQYTIIYPNPWWPPIYDPWYPYPYYPVAVYYPPYYYPPVYGYNPPATPGKIRDNGSTRDPNNPGDRSRPIPPPTTPGTTVATGTTPPRERVTLDRVTPNDDTKTDEKPWWEKMRARPDAEGKPQRTVPTERTTPRDDRTVTPPPVRNTPRDDRTASTPPPTKIKPRDDRRGGDETKSSKPAYNPPKKSVPQNDGGRVERPRDDRRSYSPPPAQQPSSQSVPPPRSSGGNSGGSNSGGGRKRAD